MSRLGLISCALALAAPVSAQPSISSLGMNAAPSMPTSLDATETISVTPASSSTLTATPRSGYRRLASAERSLATEAPVTAADPTPQSTDTPLPIPSKLPSPAPLELRGPHAPPKNSDNAYDLVGGQWTCSTFGGTSIAHRFQRGADAISLLVETVVKVDGKAEIINETYHFHGSSGLWSASLADGQFVAVASRWHGNTWVFHGVDSENGRTTDATMTYKRDNRDSFTRTFERTQNGDKRAFSGEKCVRVLR